LHFVPSQPPHSDPMRHPVGPSILKQMPPTSLPRTLGQLRSSEFTPARVSRSVKDELRENLIARLRAHQRQAASRSSPALSAMRTPSSPSWSTPSSPGTTSSCSACAARPNRASSALLPRCSTPTCPCVAGSELRDNPYAPISKFARDLIAKLGDETPIAGSPPTTVTSKN
jgi:magnesium chelatase subunit I